MGKKQQQPAKGNFYAGADRCNDAERETKKTLLYEPGKNPPLEPILAPHG